MDSTDTPTRSVVVAVLTYKRTEDLPELLPQLVEQANALDGPAWVLVVDNDAAASARPVVEALALPGLRYVVEPRPGIAAARNRALDEAYASGAHLLAFIDDDERPRADWLRNLVACQRRERAAGVAGAIIPDVGRIEDPWIDAGRFFVRQRHATGSEQVAASSANLLLDLRQVEKLGHVRFSEKFGMTGGEDTLFTKTVTRRGGRIVWCDEAVTVDHIRVDRLTREWVLQRHFRSGNSWARTELELAGGFLGRLLTRIRMTLVGIVRIALGTVRTGFGAVTRSRRHQARGSRTVVRGMGMIAGSWGGVYEEYKRPEPDPVQA